MRTKQLVDPEIAPMLEQFPTFSFTAETLPAIRAQLAAKLAEMAQLAPPSSTVDVAELWAPGPAGAPAMRLLRFQPRTMAEPTAGILWIHGGGYVMGSADGEGVKCTALAAELGCVVVAVDYRVAPETPHPGPVEDCYAALRWMHASADTLGIDPERIAVVGESAGGGLAAGLALLARDRGEVPLCFQLLIYPMLDDRTVTTADPHPYTGEFIWTAEANRFGWSALLGREPGGPDVSPYAAAARAADLAGLPPTFISVGTLDLFLEENLEYARRLMRAGVPTELHVYPGAIHGFPIAAASSAAQAHERACKGALRRALRSQAVGAAA